MSRPINEQTWHRMTEEIMTGMREWRSQHPKATLREMEDELDARWVRVRARMLEAMALDWTAPVCTAHKKAAILCRVNPSHPMMMRPSFGQPALLRRVVFAGCAVVLTLLLFSQSILCAAHCFLYTYGVTGHASDNHAFLCHLAPTPDQVPPKVPAFWPSVLPTLIILALTSIAWLLPSDVPAPLAQHLWSPPLPPPRSLVA